MDTNEGRAKDEAQDNYWTLRQAIGNGYRENAVPMSELRALLAERDALSTPSPAPELMGVLAELRADGWAVAVHNDYRLNGEAHTFWLLTKGDRFIKGEGRTDAEALESARRALAAGAEPTVHPLDALLPEICQLIDAVKIEWQQQGCWSEWDQSVRDRIAAYNIAKMKGASAGADAAGAVPEDDTSRFMQAVEAELRRAREKFPGDRIMTIALAEEFGELAKAMLDESGENVWKEAVQTAVMAARVAIDGDSSVDDWRASKGLDNHRCAGAARQSPAKGE